MSRDDHWWADNRMIGELRFAAKLAADIIEAALAAKALGDDPRDSYHARQLRHACDELTLALRSINAAREAHVAAHMLMKLNFASKSTEHNKGNQRHD